MDVNIVSYRRKFNLGNYESADIEISAYVMTGEDPKEVLTELQAMVNVWAGGHLARKKLR